MGAKPRPDTCPSGARYRLHRAGRMNRPPDRSPGQASRPPCRRPARSVWRWVRGYGLPVLALLFLLLGAIAWFTPSLRGWSDRIWLIGLLTTGTPVVLDTVRGMLHGRFAADVVATLAIVTAVLLGEPLPGLVVVLMQTGGESLERYAAGKASDAVRELEAQAPRTAHVVAGNAIRDVSAEEVRVGDTVLVRPGEMIPCDGVVLEGRSTVDASRLTGEPVPVSAEPGTRLLSGSLNGHAPLLLEATAISQESQYAKIVELVRTAQASKAPLQRLADRYAVWFTPLTLVVAGAAYFLSGEVERILAVLVVATPCPLILATPVAIIGGINAAARRRIIIRTGGALEQLGRVTVGVFDKTGTLTVGLPEVRGVRPTSGFSEDELLAMAAAVEVGSGHLLARTVVAAAKSRGLQIPRARDVEESPGQGVAGTVGEKRVAVGTRPYIASILPDAADELETIDASAPGLHAFVSIGDRIAGTIEYADRMRPGLAAFFRTLHELGIRRTILLSGDRQANVDEIARQVGIREARGDLLPEDKVRVVERLVDEGHKVLMVGDGINDAPALSAATVGIALAGHGGGITAEASDVVLLVDDLDRVADAIRVSKRAVRIALQSIGVGLGLSGGAMIFAAFGMIPPTVGAFLQEAIDVAVILNSIRARR